jgi:hypothetical protein
MMLLTQLSSKRHRPELGLTRAPFLQPNTRTRNYTYLGFLSVNRKKTSVDVSGPREQPILRNGSSNIVGLLFPPCQSPFPAGLDELCMTEFSRL